MRQKTETLSERVAVKIRQYIIENEMKAGDRLPNELQMAFLAEGTVRDDFTRESGPGHLSHNPYDRAGTLKKSGASGVPIVKPPVDTGFDYPSITSGHISRFPTVKLQCSTESGLGMVLEICPINAANVPIWRLSEFFLPPNLALKSERPRSY